MSAARSKLLKDGVQTPVVGLGTWLSGGPAVSIALKNGYRLIDTAAMYDNEDSVGKSMQESGIPREEILYVSKVWTPDHGREATLASFHNSLKRSGLDYVDLYLIHSVEGGRVLETWDTILELQRQGLVRSVGVSNFNAAHLKELKKAYPNNMPVVNEIEIHPFLAWDECVAFCEQEGVAIMAYSPLAKAEKLGNETLVAIAKTHGKSPAQVMIRWSVQRGFICIPKSVNEKRIRENIDVFDFQLSEKDMEALNGLDEHYISDWPGIMEHPWKP